MRLVLAALRAVTTAPTRRGHRLDATEPSLPHCRVCGNRIPAKFGIAVCSRPRCQTVSLSR